MTDDDRGLPGAPADRPVPVQLLTRPLARFLHVQASAGLVLLACAAFVLIVANSPWAGAYRGAWQRPFTLAFSGFELSYPLWYWVNDGLMTIFFFVIGLEIKREVLAGELSDPRRRVIPIAAAFGGAVVPAAIFFLLQRGSESAHGWAVPMATDIAFVVGCLAILGPRVPQGLKIFLLSLAIVDDLLAVTIIAAFYTEKIYWTWLAVAALGLVLMRFLNWLGVRALGVYILVGAAIWLLTLKSGVHPTVAGVLMGLLTPASAWVPRQSLIETMSAGLQRLKEADARTPRRVLEDIQEAAHEAVSPLERLEADLHPWVAFVIMPIFALANAAVPIGLDAAISPLALSIAVALLVGKPIGIVGAALGCVALGWGRLPTGVTKTMLVGAGLLGGIGFTMSIFIASLDFTGDQLRTAKTGVLAGSFAAGVLGLLILRAALRRGAEVAPSSPH